jgi:F-type H+-transporting ATPase subunit b
MTVQLDWTTLVLEMINFLVLVWLLKRLFYRPVLDVIERRRQEIAQQMAQAARTRQQAEQLQQQYERRLADWEEEKRAARVQTDQQLVAERGRRMAALEEEVQEQRRKFQSQDQQKQHQWRAQAEDEALHLAAGFAASLLRDLAGPEVDRRLRQRFVEQLATLPEAAVARLRADWPERTAEVEVLSAQVLDAEEQRQVRQALEARLGATRAVWRYAQDAALIAGLRVAAGGWSLRANLRDELEFFVGAAHEE